MTRYLDVATTAALVREIGVEPFLIELAHFIEEDFRRWPEFVKTPRVAHHVPQGVVELMPIADDALYSFKFVNGHPANTLLNLPTVMAFGVLAEVATGKPLLLSEFTLMTALRTAATSALAAKALARTDAKTMAVIGNGAQAEFQILAFKALLGIHEFRLFDIDLTATDKLQRNLKPYGNSIRLIRCVSAAEACKGADIITVITADKKHADVVTPEMVTPGQHINGVGGDCPGKTEISPDVLRMARVVVEYEPQSRLEGDVQRMPPDFPVIELWQVLTGAAKGRETPEQITVFDSVGFALEDFSGLRYLHSLCEARGAGQVLDLIPQLTDARDLYSLIS